MRKVGSALGVLLIASAVVAGATPGASTAPAAVRAFIVPKEQTALPQGEAFRLASRFANASTPGPSRPIWCSGIHPDPAAIRLRSSVKR